MHAKQSRLRHGDARKGAKTPEYWAWINMVSRCSNENRSDYPHYGGRGIRVAAIWLGHGGFERFLEHLGRRPSSQHSIDRIDNDCGYEPGNVRWASRGEQSRNRRSVRLIEYEGRSMSIADWARERGLDERLIRQRLNRGWSAASALQPPKPLCRRGWSLSQADRDQIAQQVQTGASHKCVARSFGISPTTVRRIASAKDPVR